MKVKLLYIGFVLALASCSASSEEVTRKLIVKPGAVTKYEELFNATSFDSPIYPKLLRELNICFENAIEDCPRCATVSPRFFKFYKINAKDKVENMFGLQVKALTILKGKQYAIPSRQLIIYQREAGNLVKVNEYKGNLIEKITTTSGVDDLIIRFMMKEQMEDNAGKVNAFFNCLFKWNGTRYEFNQVEAIVWGNKGGPVKAEFKKETSADVYSDLISRGYIISDLGQ